MNKLLFSQRQNIKRVVDVAEDLLGYRLNRLNNSLLWTSLNRPGMTVAPTSTSTSSSIVISGESMLSETGMGHSNPSAIREDEAKVILRWIDKLKGSEHPLLKYTRQFDTGSSPDRQEFSASSYQIRSMVVLLVANMFRVTSPISLTPDPSQPLSSSASIDNPLESVISKQKALAEIAETIYTAHMLHRTVVEIPKDELPTLGKIDSNCASDDGDAAFEEIGIGMHQGNKVATLMGDLLLARCSKALYSLKNSTVTEMMSDSIADFSESEAIALSARVLISNLKTPGYNALPRSMDDLMLILNFEKWLRRSSLGIGSLLENACFSSLILSGHEMKVRSLAGTIGHKIGLALQAHKDLMTFENDLNSSPQVDLCSLPVIFQLEKNSNLISSRDVKQIHEEVRNSSFAKAKTRQTLLVLTDDAIRYVSKFSGSSSKLLQDFLGTLSS